MERANECIGANKNPALRKIRFRVIWIVVGITIGLVLGTLFGVLVGWSAAEFLKDDQLVFRDVIGPIEQNQLTLLQARDAIDRTGHPIGDFVYFDDGGNRFAKSLYVFASKNKTVTLTIYWKNGEVAGMNIFDSDVPYKDYWRFVRPNVLAEYFEVATR